MPRFALKNHLRGRLAARAVTRGRIAEPRSVGSVVVILWTQEGLLTAAAIPPVRDENRVRAFLAFALALLRALPERCRRSSRDAAALEALLPCPGRREIYLREIVSPKYSNPSKPYQNSYCALASSTALFIRLPTVPAAWRIVQV